MLHIFPEAGISQVCRCSQSRFWGECLYLFSPEAGVSEFCLCNQSRFVSEYLHYSPEVGISEACRWIMSVIFRAKCGFRKVCRCNQVTVCWENVFMFPLMELLQKLEAARGRHCQNEAKQGH